jgi:hypothetical protein
MLKWLYDHWMKATPFLAFYSFILIYLYIEDKILYLIWLQTIIYWVHEFEEYIFPGGFLDFFNKNMMGSEGGEFPLSKIGSFWINIPLVYISMPFSAVLAHFYGYELGLWTCYFSFLNAFSHVVMFFMFGRKYNPGLVASITLNIPFAIYGISVIGPLLSFKANVLSIIVGIIAQISMMIYGFGFLKPLVKKKEEEVLKDNE